MLIIYQGFIFIRAVAAQAPGILRVIQYKILAFKVPGVVSKPDVRHELETVLPSKPDIGEKINGRHIGFLISARKKRQVEVGK